MGTPIANVAEAAARLHALAVADGNAALAKSARRIVELSESIEVAPTDAQSLNATVLKGAAREEDRFLLVVAWPANRLTAKGADHFVDVAAPRAVELGAWSYMLKGARTGVGHKPGGEDACRVVESYVYRPDTPWKIQAPDGTVQTVTKGDWLVGLLLSSGAWSDYKAGHFGGVSMQGRATRRPASAETLASLRS